MMMTTTDRVMSYVPATLLVTLTLINVAIEWGTLSFGDAGTVFLAFASGLAIGLTHMSNWLEDFYAKDS